MGVPSFYKWLTNKYPKVVVDAVEDKAEIIDASLKNPNELEFDNLYLDMNGIIHPCFHPRDSDFVPATFEEVFENIYEYVDRIFNIVRPRKLLYMAIDGVAPRAKMNQQRTRRFRNAKDQEISEKEEERLRREFELQGKIVVPKEVESETSDSNVITPGTEFMQLLAMKLKSYIKSRMCANSAWKNIKVILSNANVPGEGEHKIMSYIRAQRSCPGYYPNTRHCLYGLDADLIMLALATHEIHFSILRENVLHEEKLQNLSSLEQSVKKECDFSQNQMQDAPITCKKVIPKKPHQFLHVWILREYLELDLQITDPPKDFLEDLERLIDDFIFICFFAGNDFLPHMPTLEIYEGAIDLLMHVYRKEFRNLGGYLVDMSRVDDKKCGFFKQSTVEKFILAVGSFEDQIFRKRLGRRDWLIRRILLDDAKAVDEAKELSNETFCSFKASNTDNPCNDDQASASGPKLCIANNYDVLENTRELKNQLKESLRASADTFKYGVRKDKVRLGEEGWKKRYYLDKFSVDGSDEIECLRKELVQKYTEGLCWVLRYYFSGVPSWSWFYPYHYGPFASDLKGLSQVKVKFDKGFPFKPFDQLMAVFPPRSSHALPGPFKQLMLDETSPIIDFYPNDFEIDPNGKRFLWAAICKLPFIEEACLLIETTKLQSVLKDHEIERNAETTEMLFVASSTPLGGFLLPLYKNGSSAKETDVIEIDASLRELSGSIYFESKELSGQGSGTEDSESTDVLCAFYKAPSCCLLGPRPLEGVEYPIKIVEEADISETTLWHENSGRNLSSSSMAQFNAKGPNTGEASSDRRTGWGWGRGRGNFNSFSPQTQMPTYSDVRSDWRGRQNNCRGTYTDVRNEWRGDARNGEASSGRINAWGWGRGNCRGTYTDVRNDSRGRQNNSVNRRTEVLRPIYRAPSYPRGPVPVVEYRGAGVGWGRGRGNPCSSTGELRRHNEFQVHTSTSPDGNVAATFGSAWTCNNRRCPTSTPNFHPVLNKGSEIDAGLQRMSALHISRSAGNEEVAHSGLSLSPCTLKQPLKQRGWWPRIEKTTRGAEAGLEPCKPSS